jgi:hypothetical protein
MDIWSGPRTRHPPSDNETRPRHFVRARRGSRPQPLTELFAGERRHFVILGEKDGVALTHKMVCVS